MATKAKAGAGKASAGKAGAGKAERKGRSSSGRTTHNAPANKSDRYTPPIPKSAKSSPMWMGIVIIALFVLGVVIVILNYAGFLPGAVDNWWLVAAIGAIFAGLLLATRYH